MVFGGSRSSFLGWHQPAARSWHRYRKARLSPRGASFRHRRRKQSCGQSEVCSLARPMQVRMIVKRTIGFHRPHVADMAETGRAGASAPIRPHQRCPEGEIGPIRIRDAGPVCRHRPRSIPPSPFAVSRARRSMAIALSCQPFLPDSGCRAPARLTSGIRAFPSTRPPALRCVGLRSAGVGRLAYARPGTGPLIKSIRREMTATPRNAWSAESVSDSK